MEDTDLAFSPVWRLRELLDNRAVSSVELTEPFLRRIEAINLQLNAFLTVTAEEALAAARVADEKLSQGKNDMPLVGIPISIKDLELIRGIRTTLGSLIFQETVPDSDSAVVERVRAAGGVILGKTNAPEFGLQETTENRLRDPCRNPWNTERTPGGSSGGGGAAVAAGLCAIATGTDGRGRNTL